MWHHFIKSKRTVATNTELIHCQHIKKLCGSEIANYKRKGDKRFLLVRSDRMTSLKWRSLSGFPEDQVQDGLWQRQVEGTDALRLRGAWIFHPWGHGAVQKAGVREEKLAGRTTDETGHMMYWGSLGIKMLELPNAGVTISRHLFFWASILCTDISWKATNQNK